MKSHLRLFPILCALCALCGSIFFSGCSDDPASRIKRASKAVALGVLAEDANSIGDLERIASTVDGLTAGTEVSDAIIATVLGELVERGDIDRRKALLFAAVAQELWAIFRPAGGVLTLDPKRREAIAGFAAGIREAIDFSRRIDGTAALTPPTPLTPLRSFV